MRSRCVPAWAFLLSMLGACESEQSFPDLDLRMTDAAGNDPVVGSALTSVKVWFRQSSDEPGYQVFESSITGGTFDLPVRIRDLSAAIDLRFALYEGSTLARVGALPTFFPGESLTLRAVVGAPGTCEILPDGAIPTNRRDLGAVVLGSYALLVGGNEIGGPSTASTFFDLLRPGAGDLAALPEAIGRTRVAALSRRVALVVGELGAPFAYDLYANTTRRTPLTLLHAGGTRANAVLAAESHGAVVVGGDLDGTPVADVTWVSVGSGTYVGNPATLTAAMPERAAAFAAGALWVVSRADGDAMLERLAPGEATAAVLLPAIVDGVRDDGLLFVSRDGSQALLLGGTDENGMPRPDSVALSGCPAACVAASGPTWTNARTLVTSDPSGLLVGGRGDGANLVEQVVFGPSGPQIVPLATLVTPREGAGVVVFPAGVALVFGGEGPAGLLRTTEICFPATVEP